MRPIPIKRIIWDYAVDADELHAFLMGKKTVSIISHGKCSMCGYWKDYPDTKYWNVCPYPS